MLEEKGFDLWANGYDESVSLSDEKNEYPFAGYKKVMNDIYNTVMSRPESRILDIGLFRKNDRNFKSEDAKCTTG